MSTKEYRFFRQPMELKLKASKNKSKYFNGYTEPRTSNVNPGESVDVKESVGSYFQ